MRRVVRQPDTLECANEPSSLRAFSALLVLTGMLVRPVRAQQSDSVALQADSVVLEDWSLPASA